MTIPAAQSGGKAGIDVDAYAAELQQEGAEKFMDSWKSLLATIAEKRAAVTAGS